MFKNKMSVVTATVRDGVCEVTGGDMTMDEKVITAGGVGLAVGGGINMGIGALVGKGVFMGATGVVWIAVGKLALVGGGGLIGFGMGKAFMRGAIAGYKHEVRKAALQVAIVDGPTIKDKDLVK